MDEVIGALGKPRIHAHVQGAISSNAKPALSGIKLMRADPEVGEDAVYLFHPVQAQEVGCKSEVFWNQCEPTVFGDIGFCIWIAIETKQPAIGAEGVEYALAVAAAAKSAVHVSSGGLQVEPFEGGVKQHGNMVGRGHQLRLESLGLVPGSMS